MRIKFTNQLATGAGGQPLHPGGHHRSWGRGWVPTGAATELCTRRTAPPSISMAATLRGSAMGRLTSGPPRPARQTSYPEGRQRAERPRHAGPGRRVADVLLHQPAERPADVLPRPCLRHHPPQCLCRRGRGLPVARTR